MDRDVNTAAFLLVRTAPNNFGSVLKTFSVGANASGPNDKVDASYGAIRAGDLLVASPTPGHAMRAENPAPGTVIGKALEPLSSGEGLVQMLVMMR